MIIDKNWKGNINEWCIALLYGLVQLKDEVGNSCTIEKEEEVRDIYEVQGTRSNEGKEEESVEPNVQQIRMSKNVSI